MVIQVQFADIPRLVQAFSNDLYSDPGMIRDAVEHQSMFNVIDPNSGLKIDFWVLKLDPFDEERFRRRRSHSLFGHAIWMPSPEDVILAKLWWYQKARTDKHLNDARGVWDVQAGSLDRGYLRHWATELQVLDWLEKLEIHDG